MSDIGAAIPFEPIAFSEFSTVVAEYAGTYDPDAPYQSEADLETEFIAELERHGYEHLQLKSEAELIANLRKQLELLNKITFSDAEWTRFFETVIAGQNLTIIEKTALIQEAPVQLLKRDDGTDKNIRLIDRGNIHNNTLQFINQYSAEGNYKNRYDVTVLINGLPMVHIELKRRGVDIREAFNQIERYARDSFWAGSGLFEYVQLFVISNGTITKYYSNTTRNRHVSEKATKKKQAKQTSNSFEFTSYWADANNRAITDLIDFARTFFARHTLLNIVSRYCVFSADRNLLVMRPYQIAATERILSRIAASITYKSLGTVSAGGYVWHTTGSGKTLTSFKTAQLVCAIPGVDKVLFVVDRKDLDYQTMLEYDRFQKGAANANASTAILKKQLEDSNARIIITTIQKLANFIRANKNHQVYRGHIVIIFDECHRSQFGEMHTAITRAFKRCNLFGFTGTPIFTVNMASGGNPNLKTTEQAFGLRLHTYTIVHAITDKNVLPFRIDYVNTIKSGSPEDKQVKGIDAEAALIAPQRIAMVTRYILDHFDQKTKRNTSYTLRDQRLKGFNALFATASISAAMRYYEEFKKQQEAIPPDRRLKIGIIFSYAANEAVEDGALDEEGFEPAQMPAPARDFLEAAIQDYNALYGTSYDTSSDKFENYYKDLSMRMKERQIDLVIVVNMFLTGFDATTLNTLFVDKRLREHGLIQAYSRTNRILNSVKAFGNIVSFRNLDKETNEALAHFGNENARGVVVLKPFAEYYTEYQKTAQELLDGYPLTEEIHGEQKKKDFVVLFGSILRLQNILNAFDEFADQEIITQRQGQDYRSIYLSIYAEFKGEGEGGREDIVPDIVFEIELIKQVEINVDYILMLVEKLRNIKGDGKDVAIRAEITRAISSSPTLRSKKDLIEGFVDTISLTGSVSADWRAYVAERREAELEEIIAAENLKPAETRAFVDSAFREGSLRTTGTDITAIMPPTSRFSKTGDHSKKKQSVITRLLRFFERFFGLGG